MPSLLNTSGDRVQTPPPDDPTYAASTSKNTSRAWFPAQQPTSYQSGGIPTFNTSQAGGLGALEDAEAESANNMWETRYGFRVDLLAAFAYLLGPISGSYHLHNLRRDRSHAQS